MFLFGLVSQVLFYIILGFLQPTLAIYLNAHDLETFWIGVFFSLPAVMYIVGTFLIPCYLSLIGRKGVIFCAFIFLILGVFMIGTSPLLSMHDSKKTIFFGLMLLGFTGSAITIPVLPEMLDSII